ncbi:MAG: type IIL restriction-modification enzyme MmeI, partial [Flavobacterium sp.]
GHIVHANACRIDWEEVCPKKEGDEIYILGNPPYLGAKELSKEQKEDVKMILETVKVSKRLDYIACWFVKGGNYIKKTTHQYAFVSTDSICQGEQVEMLWPYIFSLDLDISFAYQSFKWSNNAKNSAGITVVILGLKTKNNLKNKLLFDYKKRSLVQNINPYLIEGNNIIISPRTIPISTSYKMILGSSGFDGGNLLLTEEERLSFLRDNSQTEKFIRQFLSGDDFLNGNLRYCLWIEDNELELANSIEIIKERIQKCYEYRITGGRDAQKAASVPHRFFYRTYVNGEKIIFPKTTSSRREYVPVGILDAQTIPSNASFIINDLQIYLLSILSSKVHNVWLGTTSARMNTSYRYSVNLTYNTFPFPKIT